MPNLTHQIPDVAAASCNPNQDEGSYGGSVLQQNTADIPYPDRNGKWHSARDN
jgi:hypothetical protein